MRGLVTCSGMARITCRSGVGLLPFFPTPTPARATQAPALRKALYLSMAGVVTCIAWNVAKACVGVLPYSQTLGKAL